MGFWDFIKPKPEIGKPPRRKTAPKPKPMPDYILPQAQGVIIDLPSQNRTPCKLDKGTRTWKSKGKNVSAKIDLVVIHATAGAFAPSLDWLRKSDRDNRTSAHYIIDKNGGIVRLVDERDLAWHAGYGTWDGRGGLNGRSIGIELENSNSGKEAYPRPQLEACMLLCTFACRDYGVTLENVVGHADVDPKRKTDPAGFPWDSFKESLQKALEKGW